MTEFIVFNRIYIFDGIDKDVRKGVNARLTKNKVSQCGSRMYAPMFVLFHAVRIDLSQLPSRSKFLATTNVHLLRWLLGKQQHIYRCDVGLKC